MACRRVLDVRFCWSNTTLCPSSTIALTEVSGRMTSASKNFMQHLLPSRTCFSIACPPTLHFRLLPQASPMSSPASSRHLPRSPECHTDIVFTFGLVSIPPHMVAFPLLRTFVHPIRAVADLDRFACDPEGTFFVPATRLDPMVHNP